MSTVIKHADGSFTMYTKGASEIIIKKCKSVLNGDGEVIPFGSTDRDNVVSNVISPFADDALRTIGLAYRNFSADEAPADWEDEAAVINGLTLIGIVGIEDPVRPEVPKSIAQCQRAGITVRMVTGDNVATARSIATKCGILSPDSQYTVMDGKEFNQRIRDGNGVVQQSLLDQVNECFLPSLLTSMPGLAESPSSRPLLSNGQAHPSERNHRFQDQRKSRGRRRHRRWY